LTVRQKRRHASERVNVVSISHIVNNSFWMQRAVEHDVDRPALALLNIK
jgi:hypothetical protein